MNPADQRRSERVRADLAVSFRELDDAEAEQLSQHLPLGEPGEAPFPAPYAPSGVALPAAASGGPQGRSENLSLGGLSLTGDLQILGEKRLVKGRRMLVEFHLPGDSSDEPVRALAVVAWCLEGNGPHGKFTAGIMFLGIQPGDLLRIQSYVESQKA
jgi:hypothetical protein